MLTVNYCFFFYKFTDSDKKMKEKTKRFTDFK